MRHLSAAATTARATAKATAEATTEAAAYRRGGIINTATLSDEITNEYSPVKENTSNAKQNQRNRIGRFGLDGFRLIIINTFFRHCLYSFFYKCNYTVSVITAFYVVVNVFVIEDSINLFIGNLLVRMAVSVHFIKMRIRFSAKEFRRRIMHIVNLQKNNVMFSFQSKGFYYIFSGFGHVNLVIIIYLDKEQNINLVLCFFNSFIDSNLFRVS